jgi:hypothetical protein
MGNVTITEENLIRYLLGELTESEQAAVEERFITDSEIYTLLREVESDLIADYVRKRLEPRDHERFERHYMTTPDIRLRVRVADILLSRIDQEVVKPRSKVSVFETLSRERASTSNQSYRWALGLVGATAVLSVVLGGGWLVKGSRQLRLEANAIRLDSMRREMELLKQIDGAKQRNVELSQEIDKLRIRLQQPQATKSPMVTALPITVKHVMLDGTLRDIDGSIPPPLVILPQTDKVQLIYKMEDSGYPSYRAEIQSSGGEKIWRNESISPKLNHSVATFTITLSASEFTTGAYTLMLSGVNETGDVDHLSQPTFQVERR